VQPSEKAWFLYVLRCADDTFYTGTTTDITRRIDEHNTKKCGSKYTKTRRPVELIFWLDFENRSQAQKAEYKFKKLTRTQKEKIINASR
jgi:putative endonuclease